MRILYITNGIVGAGGLERVLSIKASYLADKLGYEVHILTLNQNDSPQFYEFSPKITLHDIHVEGNPLRYFLQYYKGIKKVVKTVAPDVIVVCDDGLKGFFLPLLLRKFCPMVYERHVSKEIEMKHDFSSIKKLSIKIKWFLMERLARNFNQFIVLTKGNKKEWPSLKNMMVIANPLSFYPERSSQLTNKKVIAVGKQGYQKGYDLLLPAWKLVTEKHPDWQLSIYGKKDSSQGLETQAKELNIQDHISFCDPEKGIEQKYLESSIYVMSSRFEGFGMVLIEAMACGVPCVSFDCNYGPADIIQDGKDGFLVTNGDTDAFADKVIKLIVDEDLRKIMGAKAKENVKRYLPEEIVPQWDVLFRSLVK